MPVAYEFSNDYRVVQSSILGGSAVSGRSDLGQRVMNFARSLAPKPAPKTTRKEPAALDQRKYLEFFNVSPVRDKDIVWRG
jgi:hypothetical protein